MRSGENAYTVDVDWDLLDMDDVTLIAERDFVTTRCA
jgi:hypothetical protein